MYFSNLNYNRKLISEHIILRLSIYSVFFFCNNSHIAEHGDKSVY